jgi:hypothetical protein
LAASAERECRMDLLGSQGLRLRMSWHLSKSTKQAYKHGNTGKRSRIAPPKVRTFDAAESYDSLPIILELRRELLDLEGDPICVAMASW